MIFCTIYLHSLIHRCFTPNILSNSLVNTPHTQNHICHACLCPQVSDQPFPSSVLPFLRSRSHTLEPVVRVFSCQHISEEQINDQEATEFKCNSSASQGDHSDRECGSLENSLRASISAIIHYYVSTKIMFK